MAKPTDIEKPKGRDMRGRFAAGNSAAVGRLDSRRRRLPVVSEVPLTLDALLADLEMTQFEAFLAEELKRLTQLGEALC